MIMDLQRGILIAIKKRSGFRGDVLVPKPNSYYVCIVHVLSLKAQV